MSGEGFDEVLQAWCSVIACSNGVIILVNEPRRRAAITMHRHASQVSIFSHIRTMPLSVNTVCLSWGFSHFRAGYGGNSIVDEGARSE